MYGLKLAAVCVAMWMVSSALGSTVIKVSADGGGDGTHRTVQAAIDAIADGNDQPVTIEIAPGTYKEKLRFPKNKHRITVRGMGDDPSKTVLTYDDFASRPGPDGQNLGTTGSTSVFIDGNDFVAENITFENSAGDVGQAVAVKISGDRVVFRNCRFLGWQDTLYPHGGRCYFVDCYIEGRVDFIFGRSVAVFERCHIHSKNGGYVTAPATPEEEPWGFVFLDCKLTGDDVPTYLGRPWRDFGATAFIRCEIGGHIRPEGWHHWEPHREQTARFIEWGNTGAGADRSKRVAWAKTLADEEAAKITAHAVLAGKDGWQP